MRKLILLLLVGLSFLLSPAPRMGDKLCGRYVHLTSFAGFTINPDTYNFIFPAIQPSILLREKEQRQSRPLFILLGSAVGYTVYYVTYPFHSLLDGVYRKYWGKAYPEQMLYMLGNFYVSFLLINIMLLWLSLYIFEKIIGLFRKDFHLDNPVLFIFMVFIVSNPVVKAFLWTPHQQIFTLLTPLLCVYTALRFERLSKAVSFKTINLLTLGAGALLLMYGNFLLLLPVLLFGWFRNYRKYTERGSLLIPVLKAVWLVIVFFIPQLLWICILHLKGVTYYSFELEQYHQVIWIKETLSVSMRTFLDTLYENTISFIRTMDSFAAILLIGLILLFASRKPVIRGNNYLLPIGIVLGIFFGFYWLLGFYEPRLTYVLVPILICLVIALCRDALNRKGILYLAGGLALAWHIYNLVSYGPFC